jgi:predicted nucleotidyltransferase
LKVKEIKKNIEILVEKGFLSEKEKQALIKLIAELKASWPALKVKLFGSKVKGKADEESDLDVLILLPCHISEDIRRRIIHKIFDLNLSFETNISPLIMSEKEWEIGFKKCKYFC